MISFIFILIVIFISAFQTLSGALSSADFVKSALFYAAVSGAALLSQKDIKLLKNRAKKEYVAASHRAVMCAAAAAYLSSCGKYLILTIVLAAAVYASLLVFVPLWWENMRKTLFFNKVVNPFETDFLISFGLKNEVLKFFGVLREADKSRHIKNILFMCIVPVSLIAAALCLLCCVFSVFISADAAYFMRDITLAAELFCHIFMTLFSIKSTIKFYKPKKK